MTFLPDYQFLYLDPVMGADWFFIAARRYWEKYRPFVIHSLDLIDLAPPKSLIVITILARRDLAPKILPEVEKRFPRAIRDPLVYDVVADLKLTLDARADLDQPFGVPEGTKFTPTPGITPSPKVSSTPTSSPSATPTRTRTPRPR